MAKRKRRHGWRLEPTARTGQLHYPGDVRAHVPHHVPHPKADHAWQLMFVGYDADADQTTGYYDEQRVVRDA